MPVTWGVCKTPGWGPIPDPVTSRSRGMGPNRQYFWISGGSDVRPRRTEAAVRIRDAGSPWPACLALNMLGVSGEMICISSGPGIRAGCSWLLPQAQGELPAARVGPPPHRRRPRPADSERGRPCVSPRSSCGESRPRGQEAGAVCPVGGPGSPSSSSQREEDTMWRTVGAAPWWELLTSSWEETRA